MSEIFKVGDRKFWYDKMKLREQMKLWPALAKDVGPLLTQLKGLQGENLEDPDTQVRVFSKVLGEASGVLEHVETYFSAVVARTEVDVSPIAVGKQPLAAWEEQVFQHPGQVLEYVVKCLQIEFGPFLAELLGKEEQSPSETPKTAD